jgi:hypothetical protein
MAKLITAIIVKDTQPVNSVALSSENSTDWFSNFDGTCVVPDPEDDFGTEFITLTGCIAVDVTGLDPMPGVGSGWQYVKGKWVAPPTSKPEKE